MVVSPIRATDGELWGVLQLVNKRDGLKITDIDISEIESVLPALAETIKMAESVRVFNNVS